MTLQVIGAGLGRTGTLSMKLALEKLGFGPCFHMTELITDFSRMPAWLQAAEGAPDWDTVFDGFVATVDYPGCTYWRELAEHYPSARVLLTVRDPDGWFESTQATIFSQRSRAMLAASPLADFFHKAVWGGFADRIEERDFMTAAFERHNEEVRRSIPEERLLVYEVGSGWDPLCEFLGVPVPADPFPHANSRDELRELMAARAAEADQAMSLEQMSEQVKARLADLKQRHR